MNPLTSTIILSYDIVLRGSGIVVFNIIIKVVVQMHYERKINRSHPNDDVLYEHYEQ